MKAWALIAERRIQEAMAEGKFDNLPGRYKPLPEEVFEYVPPELRLGLKVLKNAGILPPEMELRKQIAALEDAAKSCTEPDRGAELRRDLANLRLRYDLMTGRK